MRISKFKKSRVLGSWFIFLLLVTCGSLVVPPSVVVCFASESGNSPPVPLKLWYEKPASKWVEAMPLGNGRLGAMVFGGIPEERLQLNEDTLWNGEPHDYAHEGASKYLPKIRKLLFEGKQKEAERLASREFMSVPLRQKAYQPLGDLKLRFPGHKDVQNYRRQLNIDSSVATITYKAGGISYKRELFASYPDQVIAIRLTADRKNALNFEIAMESPHSGYLTKALPDDTLSLRGTVENGVVKFEARVLIRTSGGKKAVTGNGAKVTGADSALLLLAAASSYKNYKDVSGNPEKLCDKYIASVRNKTYSELKRAHIRDYRSLFRRLVLDLGSTAAANGPTDVRIKSFGKADDPHLAVLYYQFGRYLMISASRPGSQPMNLQGIWNKSKHPPWECKYTTNINTEMNYWPAEKCNLPECHQPLFDLIEEVSETGSRVAEEHYDCPGWVLHHNTDGWRGAAPINASNHGIWVTGGAWLCQHLWWHYEYSGDKEFLKDRAYPLIRSAARFFAEFLIEDPEYGWLVSTPSNSPERGGLVAGPTMDHQIIRNLFSHCIEGSRILGVDKPLRERLAEMKKKIAPNRIGKAGQLMEWYDHEAPHTHHRHVSHLWAVHPGKEITIRGTPKLYRAARKSLELRGDGGTGWSKAWKINFWARFEDGDHAYKMLSSLISTGTYPNMFDAHPPFQIDGNFGATSGITEMLLQSHAGEISLLPALPGKWDKGSIKGLRARGGFQAALSWEEGALKAASLKSKLGKECELRTPCTVDVSCQGKTIEVKRPEAKVAVFNTGAGKEYVIKPR